MSRAKPAKPQKPAPYEQAGSRIAQARRELAVRSERDIAGPDMARDLGVSTETVRSWEAGETRPREAALGQLAAYLGVTPAWIIYGVDAPALGREHLAPLPRSGPKEPSDSG